MRYLFDTGSAAGWIYRRGSIIDRSKRATLAGARIGICTPVLGELWAGIQWSNDPDKNAKRLARALARLPVWPYDNAAAQEYGRIYAALRRRGRLIQQIDMQIAAVALTLGDCTVVSKDKDFNRVPGLAVEDWSSP